MSEHSTAFTFRTLQSSPLRDGPVEFPLRQDVEFYGQLSHSIFMFLGLFICLACTDFLLWPIHFCCNSRGSDIGLVWKLVTNGARENGYHMLLSITLGPSNLFAPDKSHLDYSFFIYEIWWKVVWVVIKYVLQFLYSYDSFMALSFLLLVLYFSLAISISISSNINPVPIIFYFFVLKFNLRTLFCFSISCCIVNFNLLR